MNSIPTTLQSTWEFFFVSYLYIFLSPFQDYKLFVNIFLILKNA